MGSLFFKRSYLFLVLFTFLQALTFTKAQNGLQVDLETSFSLSRDPLPNSGVSGTLNDESLAWRLSRDVIPIEYDITITPIIVNETSAPGVLWDAPGFVIIHVRAAVNTSRITLHSKDINITSLEVITEAEGTQQSLNYTTGNYSFLHINLAAPLVVNKTYAINVNYTAKVKDGLDGLYRSSYFDPDTNTTKWIATTQMEALHARQVLPCFDEPSFKAIFHFTIGRKAEHIALANAPSSRNRSMIGFPNWIWEEFQPTPKMSTYLIAFIVSEFTYTEAPAGVLGKPVRTYAPKHYIDDNGGIYAAEKADLILNHFQNYFVEKYPLAKMDSAAVPDFFFGAMENYGLNIYRQTALLYFPNESTEAERYGITSILSHELAHQWFGNLVTTKWWTHIWLNEGFATFVAANGVNATGIGEEFEPWQRFINDAVQNSMAFDAQPEYSHPIKIGEEEWAKRSDPMSWFDRITYEKGGSLIRMMEGFLTEPVLRNALQDYLKAMQFDAATQDDLFFYLNEQAKNNSKIPPNLTMKQIMDTWTLKSGFPLIRVAVADSNSVYISQERFINNEATTQLNQEMNGLWTIPISISTKSKPSMGIEDWINNDVAVKVYQANTSEWIIANDGAKGFYRVLYDAVLTQLIKGQLELDHTFINGVTRSQLMDDYFNAAWQKYSNIETALALGSYLGKETEIVVWNTVLNNLRKPFNLLSNSGEFYASLRDFLLPRIKNATILSGGIEANLPETKGGMPVLRHLQFLDWLCAFEDTDSVSYALKLVDEWRNLPNNNTIRRDIKPVVYCSAVAHGGDRFFDFIKSRYEVVGISPKQKESLLNALACTKEISKMITLLDGVLNPSYYISNADKSLILLRLARNPLARGQLVRFFRNSTPDIITQLGSANPIVSTITTLSTYISTTAELDDIERLLQEFPQIVTANPEAIAAARTTIKDNISWVLNFAGNMQAYIRSI